MNTPFDSQRRCSCCPGLATARALMLSLLTVVLPAYAQSNPAQKFECLIEPMMTTEVGSQVQGVIAELLVDRSDFVKAGQPLARLHSTVEFANLQQAEARAAMHGEIAAREADLHLARINMQRMQSLHERKMISVQQRDEAQAQLKVAEAALRQAEDNALVLQHDLIRSRQFLNQRTVRSPVDGVVVEQSAFPGEFVYDNPIMTVAQLDPLRVEVVLPASTFGRYKPGDQAIVYPEINGDSPLSATIDVVDRLLDSYSGTFGVRLLLSNPELSITGGQKCQIEFAVDTVAQASAE